MKAKQSDREDMDGKVRAIVDVRLGEQEIRGRSRVKADEMEFQISKHSENKQQLEDSVDHYFF